MLENKFTTTLPQDVFLALINANNPSAANPFVTIADIGFVVNILVVSNYSALPAPNTVSGGFYFCENSQGTKWLHGSLGGTYYPAGLYYSNGVSWIATEVPYQATQAEVNTGTDTNKFVTPETLTNATVVTNKELLSNKVQDFTVLDHNLYPDVIAVNNQIIQASSGLTAYFYYKTLSSIIGTNYIMTTTPATGALQVIAGLPSVPSGTLLATFMTEASNPNITFIPSGIIKFHTHATKTAGTKATQLYAELYKSDSVGGTQVLLATSGYSNVLTGISAEYTVDTALDFPVTMLITDLLLVKWYTYSPLGGSAPTVDLSIEDNTVARMELPSSTVNLSGYQPLINMHSGSVTVDFGISGDILTTTIAAPWVTTSHYGKIKCEVMDDGVDHLTGEALLGAVLAGISNIVEGVSFDIIVTSQHDTWGRYVVKYDEII